MTDLFSPSEFDEWANNYDEDTAANTGFPFDGYNTLLHTIFQRAACHSGCKVLDLGIGTGNLAARFADAGCEIWGLDFSGEMLKHAQAKLPQARLELADLREPYPPTFQQRFSCIVSAYTFHHFPPDEKVDLVKRVLNNHLAPGGKVLIGDIAFQDAAEEDALRQTLGTEWEQDHYWLADESLNIFKKAGIPAVFIKISGCAGVFEFSVDKH